MSVSLNACQGLNVALNNVIGGNLPRIPNAGTLYALMASTFYMPGSNIPNAEQGMNLGFVRRDVDGKPIVSITHYQPDTAATSTSKDCTAAEYMPVKNDFKLSLFRQTSVQVGMTELSALCGDATNIVKSGSNGDVFNIENTSIMEEVRLKIMSKMYKLVADINADLLTKISTSFGKNMLTGLATAKAVTLFDSTSGALLDDGYADILEDAQDNNFLHNPIVIGGRKMSKYARRLNWGAGNASGADFQQMREKDPVMFFKDTAADTILGANNIAVLAPDMVKLVTFNQYKGVFSGTHGNSQLGSFTLKEFGDKLRFDLKVTAEDCPDEYWKVIISVSFDAYIPANVYKTGSAHAGVNGLLRYAVS